MQSKTARIAALEIEVARLRNEVRMLRQAAAQAVEAPRVHAPRAGLESR